MDIKELKSRAEYEFECNMSNEYGTYGDYDEWGSAFMWIGDIGVEYNFCIDRGENYCAIYKMKMNYKTDYMETDYSDCIHYEIDFSKPNWEEELEDVMCRALIELHEL